MERVVGGYARSRSRGGRLRSLAHARSIAGTARSDRGDF